MRSSCRSNILGPGDIALSDSAAVILSRQSATMLQFQHERACFGKAG
jgi:hypothetical protein